MTQLALGYSPEYAAEDGWRAVKRIFAEVVEAMTQKAVCELLDVTASGMSDAIAERANKRIAAEWVMRLIVVAPEHHARRLIEAVAELRDYEARKREPNPAEELRRHREWLARRAPALAEMAEIELRPRR